MIFCSHSRYKPWVHASGKHRGSLLQLILKPLKWTPLLYWTILPGSKSVLVVSLKFEIRILFFCNCTFVLNIDTRCLTAWASSTRHSQLTFLQLGVLQGALQLLAIEDNYSSLVLMQKRVSVETHAFEVVDSGAYVCVML